MALNRFNENSSQYLRDLVESFEEESRLEKFLSLVWFSGPITAIALSIAYFIGYQKAPPIALVVYFSIFTFSAGFISVLSKVVTDARLRKARKIQERKFTHLVCFIPELSMVLVNELFKIKRVDEIEEAAWLHVLEDSELDEYPMLFAIELITGDRELAEKIVKSQVLRRKDLYVPANKIVDQIFIDHKKTLDEIQKSNPLSYRFIQQLLKSQSSQRKIGKPRVTEFLKHVEAARTDGAPERVTYAMCIAILRLSLEMLLGRSIFGFRWQSQGKTDFFKLIKKYEGTINRQYYLLRRQRRKKKLKPSDIAQYQAMTAEINRLKNEIRILSKNETVYFISDTAPTKDSGISLRPIEISLTKKQISEFSEFLWEEFEDLFESYHESEIFKDEFSEERLNLYQFPDLYIQRKIIKIYEKLEYLLDLDIPSRRDAVQFSFGISLSTIESHITRKTRFTYLYALVEEIEDLPQLAAVKTLYRLQEELNISLSEQAIKFFKNEFRIDPKSFDELDARTWILRSEKKLRDFEIQPDVTKTKMYQKMLGTSAIKNK